MKSKEISDDDIVISEIGCKLRETDNSPELAEKLLESFEFVTKNDGSKFRGVINVNFLKRTERAKYFFVKLQEESLETFLNTPGK